jgi:O-6-methylguanine DNA methyltransferase
MTALATSRGVAALLFGSDRYHPQARDTIPYEPQHPHLLAAQRWLAAYWRGENPPWEPVPLNMHGTPFQQAVWRTLLRIPLGETWTYSQVAHAVGSGAVPRATGGAIGRNPVAVLVPCHRVIGRNGALTGYASGLAIKQQLLRHEGVLPP